jgi:cytochrome c oxidase subunit 2
VHRAAPYVGILPGRYRYSGQTFGANRNKYRLIRVWNAVEHFNQNPVRRDLSKTMFSDHTEENTLARLYKLLVVGATFVAGAYIISAQSMPSNSVREFTVNAQKFEFSPSVIKVKRGDHVRLTVMALDAEHGFKLDEFHIERKVPKGEAVTVDFTADQAGDFSFQCSHFCGMGHKNMKGRLVVE